MARPCPAGALARPLAALASALALVTTLAATAHALIPRVSASAPPGWAAPAVPTTDAGHVDSLALAAPTTLTGGGATYLHWASSGNAAAMGGWTDRLSLDGQVVQTLVRPADPRWISHWFRSVNQGPTLVRGGRHTLTVEADVFHESGEGTTDYYDNTWSGQFVWSPTSLTWGANGWGVAPPPRGALPLPNCDGWSLAFPGGVAWSLGIASTGDDDLVLFSDYTGATSGFSSALAQSVNSSSVEFLVGQFAAPSTLYPAVQTGLTGGAAGYALSSSDATGHTGAVPAVWGTTLPGYRVTETYLVHLEAGVPTRISLARGSADPKLAVAVFPADAATLRSREQALATSSELDALDEGMVWSAPATGDYPLVVFRRDAAGLNSVASYVLELAATAGVERTATPLALAAPVPNPVRGGARLAYSLARGGRVTLTLIDVQGRRVRTLADGEQSMGPHELEWDGRDDGGTLLPAGSYWLRLDAPDGTRTRPLTLTR